MMGNGSAAAPSLGFDGDTNEDTVFYRLAENDIGVATGGMRGAHFWHTGQVANAGTKTLTNVLDGLCIIYSTQSGYAAMYAVHESAGTTEVSDIGGVFSGTVDTANSYNVYLSGGAIILQNNRTASDFFIFHVGT